MDNPTRKPGAYPLPPYVLEKLRAFIDRHGHLPAIARMGLDRGLVERAAGGFPIRPVSQEAIIRRLEALKEIAA